MVSDEGITNNKTSDFNDTRNAYKYLRQDSHTNADKTLLKQSNTIIGYHARHVTRLWAVTWQLDFMTRARYLYKYSLAIADPVQVLNKKGGTEIKLSSPVLIDDVS